MPRRFIGRFYFEFVVKMTLKLEAFVLILAPSPPLTLTPLNIAENEEEEMRMRIGRFCTFARSTSKTPPSPPMKVPSKMN